MQQYQSGSWRNVTPGRNTGNGPRFFGMRLSPFDVDDCARHMLTTRRSATEGVALFVTPNIQHIALADADPAFAAAMNGAELVVCDGFPVYRYARFRGHDVPGRVTGRDVIARMLAAPERLAGHRLFFVIDSEETRQVIAAWLATHAPGVAASFVIPPFGFEEDAVYGVDLAGRIARFETTLLFLCIGAPRSEMFAHLHRTILPPCWALCVGQSFKTALGLTTLPPRIMVALNLEWLWRILLEPKRMLRRYVPSGLGFVAAVLRDLRQR